jgi:hypothetical protein
MADARSSSKRPDWTREETILALDLYIRAWPISSYQDDRVSELSNTLRSLNPRAAAIDPKFRNPAGVYRKLTNLLSVDPKQTAIGSPNASATDKLVFSEIGDKPDEVANQARAIRAQVPAPIGENATKSAVPRFWITGMWGFDPSQWGFLGFSQDSIRTNFLDEYTPGDLVLVVGQNSTFADQADVGRLLGFLRITPEKITDFERMPVATYLDKVQRFGAERWSFAMPANAAWKIATEVKVKHLLPATYSGRWPQLIGARYVEVRAEEAQALLNVPVVPIPVFGAEDWNATIPKAPERGPLQAFASRGPKPNFGSRRAEIVDSDAWIYLFHLRGATAATFVPPDGKSLGQRRVYKIGWCVDPKERLRDLNFGLPQGVTLRWEIFDRRQLASRDEAFEVEQEILSWIESENLSLGGEFALASFSQMAQLQVKWFASNAGIIRKTR